MAEPKELDIYRDLIKPTPRQAEFLVAAHTHKFTMYGGAMGGGKSFILRWFLVDYLLRLAAGGVQADAGLFCETFTALEDRHLGKARSLFPAWLGRWRRYDYILYSGGTLKFRNLDDAAKYQSSEFAAIAVDEITKNTMDTFDILRTRLRWPGVPFTPFVCASNPGGVGHGWVRKIWLDKDPHDYLMRSVENPDGYLPSDFAFIPARATDNPHLSKDYYSGLASMPPLMRRAYLDGDWGVFQGMFFPMFKRTDHVVKPFMIPEAWPVSASFDPGWSSPASFSLYTMDFEGHVYVVGTYYQGSRSAPDHARAIYEFITKNTWTEGRLPYIITSGRDAWARKDRYAILANESTVADEFMNLCGLSLTPAVTDRIPGWWRVRSALEHKKLLFFEGTNEPMLSEIEAMIADDTVPEDIQGRGNDPDVPDHAIDQLRYMMMSIYRPDVVQEVKSRRPTDYQHPKPTRPVTPATPRYTRDWRIS